MYRLLSEADRPGFALAFESMSGFLSEGRAAGLVTLENVVGAAEAIPVTVEDAEIEVVDGAGKAIGHYWFGRLELRPKNLVRMPDGSVRLEVSCPDGWPYPHAQAIWSRWRRGSILPGEWTRYPAAQHGDWLHVVQNAWFTSGKRAMRYNTGDIVIDGQGLSSEDSFYCALGEAANGPGGYFGSNLDALDDCLRSEPASTPPYPVVWNAAAESRRTLGDAFVEAVAEVFADHRIELHER